MRGRAFYGAVALVFLLVQLFGLPAGGGLCPDLRPPQAGPEVPAPPAPVPGVRPGGVPDPLAGSPGEGAAVGGGVRRAGGHWGGAGAGGLLPGRAGGEILGLPGDAGEPGRAGVPGVLPVLDGTGPGAGVRRPAPGRAVPRRHPAGAGPARGHPAGGGRAGVLRRPAAGGQHGGAEMVRGGVAFPPQGGRWHRRRR